MPKPRFVDFRAVKREVSMVQVLEHYGLMSRMHRNGDSITGTCPIHEGQNKTAFRVSVSKNCWNCFSRCQCGGNVLDFVAKKERVSLLQAANLLVEWFGLKIESPRDDDGPPSPRQERDPSPVREESKPKKEAAKPVEEDDGGGENKPLEFVLKNLQPEHQYLTERGLSPETIQTFGLGFCSKGLHKDRIAIPIHDGAGQLVAYAGRWPGTTDKEKYRLPKGFQKSRELFNLHRAIAEPTDRPLVIVEGFFDCMKLWQHGVRRVVAIMGSSLSAAQEELIRKCMNSESQILVMLDEDEAGQKGREEIARRLARFAFVKIHVFEKPGTQPDNLTAEEIHGLKAQPLPA
jgi:DNA primase